MFIPPYVNFSNLNFPRIAGGFLPNAFQMAYTLSFRQLTGGVGASDLMTKTFVGEATVFSSMPSRIPFRHLFCRCLEDLSVRLSKNVKPSLVSTNAVPSLLLGLSVFVGVLFLAHRTYSSYQQHSQSV